MTPTHYYLPKPSKLFYISRITTLMMEIEKETGRDFRDVDSFLHDRFYEWMADKPSRLSLSYLHESLCGMLDSLREYKP